MADYYRLTENEWSSTRSGFMSHNTAKKLSKKLSKLQRQILRWLDDNPHREHWGGAYTGRDKHVYRECKYEIAKELGKTEPSELTYTLNNNKVNERVKESFHPVFKTSWEALKNRGLISRMGLTLEGNEMIKRITL